MAFPPFVPFDAFWLLLAGILVCLARILALLRSRHRSVWTQLGCPSLLPRAGIANSTALTRFYWSRRIAALGDPELQCWVILLRVLQLLLAFVLAAFWSSLAVTGRVWGS